MAGDSQKGEELLKRPLYVFDLPADLLTTLTTKVSGQQTPLPDTPGEPLRSTEQAEKEIGISTATACSLCQVSFQNVQDQREHTRSDHHRYNLKSRLRGNKVLNEAEFNKAIGELDESISGSSSESESEDEQEDGQKTPDTTLTALLKKQAKISATEADASLGRKKNGPGKHPLVWFSSPLLPPSTSLGVYRALFTNIEQEEPDFLVNSLRNKQVKPVSPRVNKATQAQNQGNNAQTASPHIFLCMIGGGHFAGMIVALAPEIHKKAGGLEDRQARVLAHKTFHRYTTRRKQGGSQSANDASKGAAHSAGSSIRRYNEAALESEIRQLLGEWKGMIDQAQFLFVRATGNTNRRILFGPYEGQVLKQSDPRIRGFPFSTRRATQSELMRAFTELTRVKVSHIDEAALAAQAEKEKQQREAAPKSPKPSSQPQKHKISKEEEAAILHTTQIQALIRRSKVPALLSYISNNSIPPSFIFHQETAQQYHRCPTPLHLAANSNSPAIVLALLTKAKVDPSSLNGEGQPAFDLAGDRATRDAFRVSRHELGETGYDWDAAHVPSPISKSDSDARAEREKKEAEAEESNRRKTEMERLRREDAEKAANQEKKRPGGRTLASAEKTASERREEETRGMTPEMRARLERERRARAAEERIRRMQGGAS